MSICGQPSALLGMQTSLQLHRQFSMRAFRALSSTGMTLKTAIAEGNEMIREHEVPAWNRFKVKVALFLALVAFVSVQCWGAV